MEGKSRKEAPPPPKVEGKSRKEEVVEGKMDEGGRGGCASAQPKGHGIMT